MGQKKITQTLGPKQKMQPLGTKKIMQPLGTRKSRNTSEQNNHATSQDIPMHKNIKLGKNIDELGHG